MIYSYTQLSQYLACPPKYRHRYLDGWQEKDTRAGMLFAWRAFHPRVDGSIEAGPNAVLALRREGYRKTDISVGELGQAMAFGGFWRMARRFWKVGAGEYYRSFSKAAFVKAWFRCSADMIVSASIPISKHCLAKLLIAPSEGSQRSESRCWRDHCGLALGIS